MSARKQTIQKVRDSISQTEIRIDRLLEELKRRETERTIGDSGTSPVPQHAPAP